MKKVIPFALLLLFVSAFTLETGQSGLDLGAIDKSIRPGDDFYRFVNGSWLRANPVPSTESRWGSFNLVAEQNNEVLRMIMEQAAYDKSAAPGSELAKVGAFYRLFMDTLKRDQDGFKPV